MRVANVGSLNIDKTYRVAEFVRPGETITALSFVEGAGGKGLNQSLALAQSGADVWHVGAVGHDGAWLIDELEEAGVKTRYIETVDNVSGHALIQVDDSGQNAIVVCGGANACVDERHVARALSEFGPGDVLLLQNETNANAAALHLAKEAGLTVAYNPSPLDDAALQLDLDAIDLFILNELEAAALAGIDGWGERGISVLAERFPDAEFLITLGSEGCLHMKGDAIVRQPAFRVDAVDTTGAGDTFCGYFLGLRSQGSDVPEALRVASAAAALSVTRRGAARAIPTIDEVRDFLEGH